MKRILLTALLLPLEVLAQQWGNWDAGLSPNPQFGNPFGNIYYNPYVPQSASPYYNPISNPSGAIPVTIQKYDNPYTPAAYGQQVFENMTMQSRMMAQTILEARRQRSLEDQQQRNYELQRRQQELAERQAALQEELYRRQIQEIERQSEINRNLEEKNAEMEKQLSGYSTSTQIDNLPDRDLETQIRASEKYDGKSEVPLPLKYYNTEIQTIIFFAKKEIDLFILKGDLLAVKQYKISEAIQYAFQDESVRLNAMSYINSELEKIKDKALAPSND